MPNNKNNLIEYHKISVYIRDNKIQITHAKRMFRPTKKRLYEQMKMIDVDKYFDDGYVDIDSLNKLSDAKISIRNNNIDIKIGCLSSEDKLYENLKECLGKVKDSYDEIVGNIVVGQAELCTDILDYLDKVQNKLREKRNKEL